MRNKNPIFARMDQQTAGSSGFAYQEGLSAYQQAGQQPYQAPAPTGYPTGTPTGSVYEPITDRMTLDDVVVRAGISIAVLIPFALIGWFTAPTMPWLYLGAMFVGMGLAFATIFKKQVSPPLILAYAALMGIGLGGISMMYQAQWDGIVQQAVLGTFSVFAVALIAYRTGRIRVTPKFQRMVIIGMFGYIAFSLLNLVLSLFGVGDGWGLRNGWVGIAVGLVAVALAAFSLVLDFDFIDKSVQAGVPSRYAWTAAFGLVVTLVWLYLELLRLLAILQGND